LEVSSPGLAAAPVNIPVSAESRHGVMETASASVTAALKDLECKCFCVVADCMRAVGGERLEM
jgi:hypothetical protein